MKLQIFLDEIYPDCTACKICGHPAVRKQVVRSECLLFGGSQGSYGGRVDQSRGVWQGWAAGPFPGVVSRFLCGYFQECASNTGL